MSTEAKPDLECSAASLATADEVFMRCAPALVGREERVTGAIVIGRDKADLLRVLDELADAMEGNSIVNKRTGGFETVVDPEWFQRFERALLRHTGRVVEL